MFYNNTLQQERYDIASAMEAMTTYDGKDEDQAIKWLRDIRMVSELTRLSSTNTLKLMMLKLTDSARSWCSLLFESRPSIVLKDFVALFKQRFANATKSQETLEKFMTALPPKNKDEYFQMLNTANNLNDTGLLKTYALIKIVITKSPENLRSLLFQVAGNDYDWQEVFKIAQESLWIAYPTSVDFSIDRNELDGTKKNYFKKLPRYKKMVLNSLTKVLITKNYFFVPCMEWETTNLRNVQL
ncbi:hypothetical protein GVAV_000871 [Gurleya vavrai]